MVLSPGDCRGSIWSGVIADGFCGNGECKNPRETAASAALNHSRWECKCDEGYHKFPVRDHELEIAPCVIFDSTLDTVFLFTAVVLSLNLAFSLSSASKKLVPKVLALTRSLTYALALFLNVLQIVDHSYRFPSRVKYALLMVEVCLMVRWVSDFVNS